MMEESMTGHGSIAMAVRHAIKSGTVVELSSNSNCNMMTISSRLLQRYPFVVTSGDSAPNHSIEYNQDITPS